MYILSNGLLNVPTVLFPTLVLSACVLSVSRVLTCLHCLWFSVTLKLQSCTYSDSERCLQNTNVCSNMTATWDIQMASVSCYTRTQNVCPTRQQHGIQCFSRLLQEKHKHLSKEVIYVEITSHTRGRHRKCPGRAPCRDHLTYSRTA